MAALIQVADCATVCGATTQVVASNLEMGGLTDIATFGMGGEMTWQALPINELTPLGLLEAGLARWFFVNALVRFILAAIAHDTSMHRYGEGTTFFACEMP